MQPDIMDKMPSGDDIMREVSRLRSTITEAVDDGFRSAVKAVEQGRDLAEDAIDDARRAIKRHPQAMGMAFVVGLLLGGVAIWTIKRR